MPIFRHFGNDPTLALLQSISEGIDNLGASFASSLSGLGNLDFNFPVFNHTELKSVNLLPDTPVLVLPGESVARRNTLKNAQSSTGIIIFVQGIENPGIEDFLKSPWRLPPGSFREDDRDGGYPIWAMAVGGAATVEVAIEYKDKPINSSGENRMQVELIYGTGINAGFQNFYSAMDMSAANELDSSVDGFKLFTFNSFEPLKNYSFSVNSGGISFQSVPYPINIYFFPSWRLAQAFVWASFGNFPTLNDCRLILTELKKLSWIGRMGPEGGTFSIAPKMGGGYGLIDVKTPLKQYADTAVLGYTPDPDVASETGTFTLLGV